MVKKKVSKKFLSKTDKLLVATIVLLSGLFIMNMVALTGFSTRMSTNYSTTYMGDNACQRMGGTILREGVSVNHNGQDVTLTTTGEDLAAVTVDGRRRTIERGHEVWINGVFVTNFISTDREACLILK